MSAGLHTDLITPPEGLASNVCWLLSRANWLQKAEIEAALMTTGLTTRQHQGLQLLDSIGPYVLNGREIATTQVNRRRIYALSSGMMTEKTLSNQLAERLVGDPRQSIFFVGYANPQSPAGLLREAGTGGT